MQILSRMIDSKRCRISTGSGFATRTTCTNVLLVLAVLLFAGLSSPSELLANSTPAERGQQTNHRDSPPPDSTGFLFLDGEYVDAPYQIELAPMGRLTINGSVLRAAEYDGLAAEAEPEWERNANPFRRHPRPGADRRPPKGALSDRAAEPRGHRGTERLKRSENLKQRLEDMLLRSHHAVVLLDQGTAPLVLDSVGGSHQFLQTLCHSHSAAMPSADVAPPPSLDGLQVTSENLQRLKTFASTYVPAEPFLARAESAIEFANRVEQMNEHASSVNVSKAKLAYPLTILAMILVAIGFGHLLSNKPVLEEEDENQRRTRSRAVVARSVTIFLLLSCIDLVWTLFSAQTGNMRELNPIGGDLIGSPVHLIAFKASLVGMTAGVLFFLHERSIAQAASWWSCLVLTLLTARWVVFQSMFL